jgi:tetratricopeptide (TPR) repeat protein
VELRRDLPLHHFAFLGDDAFVVDCLRQRPVRIPELLAEHPGLEAKIQRVLCLLILSRSLELDVPSAPPLGLDRAHATPVVVPPAPRLPKFEERAQRAPAPSAPVLEAPASAPAGRAFADLLGAQMAFHRAEVLLERGKLDAARHEAKVALEREPEKPEHIALHAFLEFLKPEPSIRKALTELDRAVGSPAAGVKVHWYRGLVLKRLGRHASALQEFCYIVEEDPNHIDAAREVHIYETRLRKSPKDRPTLAPEEPARDSGDFFERALKRLRPRQ